MMQVLFNSQAAELDRDRKVLKLAVAFAPWRVGPRNRGHRGEQQRATGDGFVVNDGLSGKEHVPDDGGPLGLNGPYALAPLGDAHFEIAGLRYFEAHCLPQACCKGGSPVSPVKDDREWREMFAERTGQPLKLRSIVSRPRKLSPAYQARINNDWIVETCRGDPET
jgi:hypothetical protein